MGRNSFIIAQLRQKNTVSQPFTQLNAPLVESKDVQDDALRKDFMLIQRTAPAERRNFARVPV